MISFLLAMDKNGLIGKDNDLPWYLPADLKYFKRVTMGHPIVMGRKTYESIGKPLPGRRNIVLTHNENFQASGCEVYHEPEAILSQVKEGEEWFVIGGAGVFNAFKPHVDRLYITYIDHEFEGDTYYEFNRSEWKLVSEEQGTVDEKNHYPHTFMVYDKI